MERKAPDTNTNKRNPMPKEPLYIIIGGNGSGLVEQILMDLGWKKQPDRNSDCFRLKWVENRSSVNYDLFREGEQMVNRIPNCFLLTNKLGLITSLQRYERIWTMLNLGRILKLHTSDFVPDTFRLDDSTDRRIFYEIFRTSNIWICKPTGMNQGRGIYLVRNLEEFKKSMEERELERKQQKPLVDRVIQRYITNPLLLDGKKFDIRAFMLVASTSPFLVLFHKGYIRLSLQTYNNDTDDLVAHLTNQFVQKRDATYEFFKEETVWSIEKFNNYVNRKIAPQKGLEYDWVLNTMMNRLKQIMLYCFHAVKHKLKAKVGYFDLYGFDFLVDENMKIWLIEINANPCLATNCETLKEVIPTVVRESLYLAIECFEKSRRGIPLYPLQTLRTFQILFNSGHSSPYFDTSHLNLKRSRSSIASMLHSFYRDDADTSDEKTAKGGGVSRNYTTSVVFDPHDDPDFAPNPVSMFDLNNIEYRKLLIYRSDLTDLFSGLPKSLSGSPKSLPTLKMSPSRTGLHYEVQQSEPKEQVNNSSENVRSNIVQDASIDQYMAREKLTISQTAVYEDETPEMSDKDLGSSPRSNTTKVTSGKSKVTPTVTDLSSDKLTAYENSSINRSPSAEVKPGHKKSRSNSQKSTTSSTVSVSDWSTVAPMTFERTYTGWLSVGNKFIKPHSATENFSESLHPVTENQDKGLVTTNQSKATIVSDKFNRSHAAWDRTKPQQLRETDALRYQSTRSLHNLSNHESNVYSENVQSQFTSVAGKVKPDPVSDSLGFVDSTKSHKQSVTTDFSYPRPGVNAVMKPIQLLPPGNSHHDKRNGSLDMFLEQLEKDLAKAKFQHAVIQSHGSYQVDNAGVNSSLSSDNTSSHSNYHIANQEFSYYDAASSSELRSTMPDYRHIVDKSKMLLPKIYPRLTLNIPPKKDDKKAYLSSQVFSAHGYGNNLGTSHHQHQHTASQSEEARYYHSNQVNEHYKDSQEKKPSRHSNSSYTAGAHGNETSERRTEFPVDNKSLELKGETLLKERKKSAYETTSSQEPKYGTWGRKVSEASGPGPQDFRDSWPASRLHFHDFSQVSAKGPRRVFPDPNQWAAELHNSVMSSGVSDNLVASFQAQDSNEKDWGHFTVVSPK